MDVRNREGGVAVQREPHEILPYPDFDATGDRRTEARIPTDDPARMRVLRPWGTAGADIRVLDVSRGGFKLLVPEMLQPSSIVQIHVRSALVLAEVRYCVPVAGGFYAGVQFQDVFWTGAGT